MLHHCITSLTWSIWMPIVVKFYVSNILLWHQLSVHNIDIVSAVHLLVVACLTRFEGMTSVLPVAWWMKSFLTAVPLSYPQQKYLPHNYTHWELNENKQSICAFWCCQWHGSTGFLWVISVSRYHLTSVGIPIIKIKQSPDHHICNGNPHT